MNIYEKMNAIMEKVEYLSKDDRVQFKQTDYRALSEEKVTSVLRPLMVEYKLLVFPIKQEVTKDGTLTTVNTVYRIVNAENPEEFIEVASSGQGADTQDKGVGKAMTYAFKYMWLRTFAIPTGEDPDKICSDELTEKFNNEEARNLIDEIINKGRAKGYSEADICGIAKVKKLKDLDIDRLTKCLAYVNGLEVKQ